MIVCGGLFVRLLMSEFFIEMCLFVYFIKIVSKDYNGVEIMDDI